MLRVERNRRRPQKFQARAGGCVRGTKFFLVKLSRYMKVGHGTGVPDSTAAARRSHDSRGSGADNRFRESMSHFARGLAKHSQDGGKFDVVVRIQRSVCRESFSSSTVRQLPRGDSKEVRFYQRPRKLACARVRTHFSRNEAQGVASDAAFAVVDCRNRTRVERFERRMKA